MVSIPCAVSSLPYRSFVTELSPSFFPRFPPSVHPLVASVPYRSFPPELSPNYFTRFPFRPLSSLPYRSFPPKLSPSYFPRLPFRPPCRHSRIAPSHRSSPQAISHGFPSVHPVSSLPYRPFPPELSPSYFRRLPFRPPCRHSRIAPSRRSSPQAISHGFPSVHPVSSLPYRSFPPELSPSYFPPFPFRPPSRHSRIAPSHRSSPHAISHGFLCMRKTILFCSWTS